MISSHKPASGKHPLAYRTTTLRLVSETETPLAFNSEPNFTNRITPHPGRISDLLQELWRGREVTLLLARRDFLVRYKRSVVGLGWVLFKPGMNTLVLTLVFGRLAGLPDHGVPYAVLVLSAAIAWQFFSGVLTESGGSIVNNQQLVTKVYLPRMLLPIATIPVNFIDLMVGLILLWLVMGWTGFSPGATAFLLPLAAIPLVITSIGAGLWSSALLARFIDLKNVIPYLLQFGMLISPVAFSSTLVPERWRWLYGLNPLVAPLDLFRWCLIGPAYPLDPRLLIPSLAMGLLLFLSGTWAFRRFERDFADVL
jgi:lipopolysaccharide transport system permease protein